MTFLPAFIYLSAVISECGNPCGVLRCVTATVSAYFHLRRKGKKIVSENELVIFVQYFVTTYIRNISFLIYQIW